MHTKRVILAVLVVTVGGAVAAASAMAGVAKRADNPEWLRTINDYRAAAGLGPVAEVPGWSAQSTEHAHYQVANGEVTATQRPDLPFATAGGSLAARNADLAGMSTELSDRQAIDLWMSSPFHALGILRAELARVGYGRWVGNPAGRLRFAAVLDIVRGLEPAVAPPADPVVWPGPGSVVPLGTYPGDEVPDPLGACAGYRTPVGLPIIAQFPADTDVAGATVQVNGSSAPSCLVDATRYHHDDPEAEKLGRSLLAGDHALFVIPRNPLPVDAEVTVTLDVNGGPFRWTFRTGSPGSAITPARPLGA